MSMYNMLHGMNAGLAVIVSPFLPMRCDKFPRFRDVFLSDPEHEGDIFVYTRMGGGNAECWGDSLTDDCDCPACIADRIEKSCIERYEDDFDFTYCTFAFKVVDHRDDFEKIIGGKINETSDWYKTKLYDLFADSPKVIEILDNTFNV